MNLNIEPSNRIGICVQNCVINILSIPTGTLRLLTIGRFLFLGEIANEMRALSIDLAQNVKEERIHIEVEGLVVQKQFGHETKILTVQFVFLAVDLVDGERALAVDLLAGWLSTRALTQVHPVGLLQPHVLQAILTDVQLGHLSVLLRVGAEIPGVDLEPAELHPIDEFDLCQLFVFFLQGRGRRVHLGEGLLYVVDFVVSPLLVAGDLPVRSVRIDRRRRVSVSGAAGDVLTLLRSVDLGLHLGFLPVGVQRIIVGAANPVPLDPLVETAVEALVMDVVLLLVEVIVEADVDDLCGVPNAILGAPDGQLGPDGDVVGLFIRAVAVAFIGVASDHLNFPLLNNKRATFVVVVVVGIRGNAES